MFENYPFIIFQEKTFDFVITISFILLFVTLFGFSQKDKLVLTQNRIR